MSRPIIPLLFRNAGPPTYTEDFLTALGQGLKVRPTPTPAPTPSTTPADASVSPA